MAQKGAGYAGRWKRWLAIYLVAGAIAYFIVLLLFFHHGGATGGHGFGY